MQDRFSRTRMLIADRGLEILAGARVAVFGLGGVGSFATEALVRCGVGDITLVDYDTVVCSNLNRQLIALESTLGRLKVEVMKERILDINPSARITLFPLRYNRETSDQIMFRTFDYVVDAIDSVGDKLLLLKTCWASGLAVISCMGTGNRIDPTLLTVGDIKDTRECPLARKIRRGLREAGIERGIKVVYSREKPRLLERHPGRVGSMALVPPVAGIIMAAEVVKDLLKSKDGLSEDKV